MGGRISADIHCYGHSLTADSPCDWSSFIGNKNVVFRMFTYQQRTRSETNVAEIDLFQIMSSAMSKHQEITANAQFSVSKRKITGNVHRIALDFADLKTLSVTVDWAH